MITRWKEELLVYTEHAFDKAGNNEEKEMKKLKGERDRLYKKIGQLTLECDFFARACENAGLKVK